jgi:hypothetical protein
VSSLKYQFWDHLSSLKFLIGFLGLAIIFGKRTQGEIDKLATEFRSFLPQWFQRYARLKGVS